MKLEGIRHEDQVEHIRTDDGKKRYYFSLMGGANLIVDGEGFDPESSKNRIRLNYNRNGMKESYYSSTTGKNKL